MKPSSSRLRAALATTIFCGPSILLYGGFVILPALLGFAYSLTDWTGWNATGNFIGLQNFRDLLHDDRFLDAVKFTLFETVLIVAFFTFATLLLAAALDRLGKLKNLVTALFFYPYILSLVVCALLFQYLANYREGAINTILRAAGLGGWVQDWMGSPSLAPYFIFALCAWQGAGFYTTLYLANLQTVPTELYEAAGLDGATEWQIFSRVQFPLLRPAIITTSVVAIISGLNLFPQVLLTTQGAPGHRTMTVGYYIYWLGVINNRQGYASAVSFVTFVAVCAIAFVQIKVLNRRQEEI